LAPLLDRITFAALAAGMPDSSATVGQVIERYEYGTLTDIYNISSGRAGEIRTSLIEAKLVDPDSKYGSKRGGERQAMPHGHHEGYPKLSLKK
jgi:hypothetical protein